MVEVDKIATAMAEVDKAIAEETRPAIFPRRVMNSDAAPGQPATLIAWLRRYDEKQDEEHRRIDELNRKLDRVLAFLGQPAETR